MRAAYVLLQAVAQQINAQPFFTDDLEGAIKIIVTLGGMASAIILSVWKFMRGDIKQDLNGLGTRVSTTEATLLTHGTRIQSLEQQREADAVKFTQLFVATGKLEQAVDHLQDSQNDGKLEILARLNDMQIRIESRINESNVQVAEMRGEVRAFRTIVTSIVRGSSGAREMGGGDDSTRS